MLATPKKNCSAQKSESAKSFLSEVMQAKREEKRCKSRSTKEEKSFDVQREEGCTRMHARQTKRIILFKKLSRIWILRVQKDFPVFSSLARVSLFAVRGMWRNDKENPVRRMKYGDACFASHPAWDESDERLHCLSIAEWRFGFAKIKSDGKCKV